MKASEDDLLAAKSLAAQSRLTHISAFHCQQCIEKCFKAIVEERGLKFIKTHDLLRLEEYVDFSLDRENHSMLEVINEGYIDARYPGDFGLFPEGKPTIDEVGRFIELADHILKSTKGLF